MDEQRITRPLPEADGRMQPFWEAARRGAFMLQKCKLCDARRFPAAECCSNCLASDLEWTRASGVGVVHSFVVIHHAVDPYFASRTPYVVVDVKLAEGPHITSTIVDSSPSEVSIDDRVEVAFEPVSEAIHLPVFRRKS